MFYKIKKYFIKIINSIDFFEIKFILKYIYFMFLISILAYVFILVFGDV